MSRITITDLPNVTPKGVSQRVVEITPPIADYWLKSHNPRNRPIMDGTRAKYARDMREGRWTFTGEAIQFDTEGNLLNGQHRLYAICDSGTTQKVLVVWGLPAEAQDHMDSGKVRSLRQQLAINGVSNASIVAALARTVILWEEGQMTGSYVPSISEMLELVDKNRTEVEYAARVVQPLCRQVALSRGVAGAFVYRANEIYPVAQVDEFIATLTSGAGLPEGDPRLVLRNRIVTDRNKGVRSFAVNDLYMLLRTWKAHLHGERYAKLQMPSSNITPAHLDLPLPRSERIQPE